MSTRTDKEIMKDYSEGKPLPDLEYNLMVFLGYIKRSMDGEVITAKGKKLLK